MEQVHRVPSTIHENRCITRQPIMKFQTTRDNEKTLITSWGWAWDGENRRSGIRMVSAFSNKAILGTRKP